MFDDPPLALHKPLLMSSIGGRRWRYDHLLFLHEFEDGLRELVELGRRESDISGTGVGAGTLRLRLVGSCRG